MQRAVTDSVSAVLSRAVSDSAFPGAYAIVGSAERIHASVGAGRTDWDAGAPRPDERTLWDLASLTKVIGMTSAVARLVAERGIELGAPVQRYLPEFAGPGKELVTVRHLLTHSSGLPAWRPLYKEGTDRAHRLAIVLQTPLDTVPGARMVYSDLGAILLGLIVERVTGEPLDRYLASRVFAPLGMTDTGYLPDSSLLDRIAPTEVDPWRQRHVHGEVHDENAYSLGGISAHAGLFGSARDLARFAQAMLRAWRGDSTILSTAVVREFTRAQDASLSHRALGWETPNGSNSAGHLLTPQAFGHTGFTGTSIWMDPGRDLFIVLLSNRVNPTRENRRIGAVRVALADAVAAAQDAARGGVSSPATLPPSR
jgi:CubicO group peptidase (beta-lactamase class C family)